MPNEAIIAILVILALIILFIIYKKLIFLFDDL